MSLDNTPPNAHASLARAEACRVAGDLPGAEAILSQVMNTFPDFDPACHALGLLAFEMGNLPLAAQWMARAISLNAGEGLYHRNLGELCRRLGRLEEAVVAGRRASALLPLDRDAHYNLGLALTDCGNWPDAIASYGSALSLHPGHGLPGTTWVLRSIGMDNERMRSWLMSKPFSSIPLTRKPS